MVEVSLKRSILTGLAFGGLAVLQSPALGRMQPAQNRPGARPANVSPLMGPSGPASLWDDAKIGRARAALSDLEVSRTRLVALMRRLRASEQSAAYAENLGRSGETSYWRRDVAQIRPVIDAELKRAKPLAAEADVKCGGCTYSDLISRVRKAIDEAVALRFQAAAKSH
jgi:hypothetical protein